MRLSEGELHRLAAGARLSPESKLEMDGLLGSTAAEAEAVAERLCAGDDVREELVLSLKERIDAGNYSVSGEEIAEMMVRRAMADRLASR